MTRKNSKTSQPRQLSVKMHADTTPSKIGFCVNVDTPGSYANVRISICNVSYTTREGQDVWNWFAELRTSARIADDGKIWSPVAEYRLSEEFHSCAVSFSGYGWRATCGEAAALAEVMRLAEQIADEYNLQYRFTDGVTWIVAALVKLGAVELERNDEKYTYEEALMYHWRNVTS